MVDALIRNLKLALRMLVRHRILFSAGLSVAAGVILRGLVVVPVGHPLFQYIPERMWSRGGLRRRQPRIRHSLQPPEQ